MVDVETSLSLAMGISGAIGVALVDFETATCFGSKGGTDEMDLELAAAGCSELVRSQKAVRDTLGLTDKIEDILVTMESQYHLIRIIHHRQASNVFIFLALSRRQANLALARLQLARIGNSIGPAFFS